MQQLFFHVTLRKFVKHKLICFQM